MRPMNNHDPFSAKLRSCTRCIPCDERENAGRECVCLCVYLGARVCVCVCVTRRGARGENSRGSTNHPPSRAVPKAERARGERAFNGFTWRAQNNKLRSRGEAQFQPFPLSLSFSLAPPSRSLGFKPCNFRSTRRPSPRVALGTPFKL